MRPLGRSRMHVTPGLRPSVAHRPPCSGARGAPCSCSDTSCHSVRTPPDPDRRTTENREALQAQGTVCAKAMSVWGRAEPREGLGRPSQRHLGSPTVGFSRLRVRGSERLPGLPSALWSRCHLLQPLRSQARRLRPLLPAPTCVPAPSPGLGLRWAGGREAILHLSCCHGRPLWHRLRQGHPCPAASPGGHSPLQPPGCGRVPWALPVPSPLCPVSMRQAFPWEPRPLRPRAV